MPPSLCVAEFISWMKLCSVITSCNRVYWSYRVNKTQFSKSVIFQPKTKIFPQKPLHQIVPCKNPSKIMIITSHMHLYSCYRINKKMWRTNRQSLLLYPLTAIAGGEDNNWINEKLLKPCTHPFKMVIVDLVWPCPASFWKQFL